MPKNFQHAHICEACHSKGKQVIWIHGDDLKGVEEAHKCPACGTVNWKKFMVEVGSLPNMHGGAQTQQIDLQRILFTVCFVVITIAMLYVAFIHFKDHKIKLVQK